MEHTAIKPADVVQYYSPMAYAGRSGLRDFSRQQAIALADNDPN